MFHDRGPTAHLQQCIPAQVDAEYGFTLLVGVAPYVAPVGVVLALRARVFVKPHTVVGLALDGAALLVTAAQCGGLLHLPLMPCRTD